MVCINKHYVHIMILGLPKYGVFPLDPLHIDILDLSDAPGKTLNVKHKFKNVDLFGLGSANVNKVRLVQFIYNF